MKRFLMITLLLVLSAKGQVWAEDAGFCGNVTSVVLGPNGTSGEKIFLGLFEYQAGGRWIGNIKRYGLGSDGGIYDATGALAVTADGMIKNDALSYWTSLGYDGPDVSKGGAAEVLKLLIGSSTPRNVYTYTGSNTLLSHAANAFVYSNSAITNADLAVASDADRQIVMTSVIDGELGDILHSEPVNVYYSDPDGNPDTEDAVTRIYVGGNDGILHCFDDDDGSEAWAFVPPNHLNRLRLLQNDDHDYFVDGSPVVYENGSQITLIVGERRGGNHYTALNISAPTAPSWLYSMGPHVLDTEPSNGANLYEILGQSWGKPQVASIATGYWLAVTECDLSIETTAVDVFLIPGGYDLNQDQESPNSTDSIGRALFAINVTSGALVSSFNFNAVSNASLGMTHSIVDLTALDHDGDGIHSRVYAGDLGGNVFAFKDDEIVTFPVCFGTVDRSVADGIWSTKRLFDASADGVQRKILYAPDAVGESYGEMIFFGTGDRSDPGETDVVNRIYAVKNDWASSASLTESNLVDVTDDLIQLGTDAEKESVQAALNAADGWFIRLENSGEKVVAAPQESCGVVYFTTYTPSSDLFPKPVSRLYALNYKTGASVYNYSSEIELDNAGETVPLGKKDRAQVLGNAIPSDPVIVLLDSGYRVFVGVEGGIISLPTGAAPGLCPEIYACEGNRDDDRDVDGLDLADIAAGFIPAACNGVCANDLNGDGIVDNNDIKVLACDFGRTNCLPH